MARLVDGVDSVTGIACCVEGVDSVTGIALMDTTVKEIIILSDIPNEGTILMSWGKLLDLLSFCFFHFIRLVH